MGEMEGEKEPPSLSLPSSLPPFLVSFLFSLIANLHAHVPDSERGCLVLGASPPSFPCKVRIS